MERLRARGDADASLRAEVVLDINCPHCAEIFSPLLSAVEPSIKRGSLHLTIRWYPGWRDPERYDLLEHVFAADNPVEFDLLCRVLVGTPEGRGWSRVRSRAAEVVNVEALESRHATMRPAIVELLQAEQRTVVRYGRQSLPFLRIVDRSGREQAQWSGSDWTPALVAASVDVLTAATESQGAASP